MFETASTIILCDHHQQGCPVLVLERTADAPRFPGGLDLIGGLALPGENPEHTALRELYEETGITIKSLEYLYAKSERDYIDHIFYSFMHINLNSIICGEGKKIYLMPILALCNFSMAFDHQLTIRSFLRRVEFKI